MVHGGSTGAIAAAAAAALAVAAAITGWPAVALAAAVAAVAAGVVAARQHAVLLEARACGDALAERFEELQQAKAEAERALAEQRERAERGAGTVAGIDAVTDRVTGMFNETFFRVTLDQRVLAARRHLRPVALVLLDVVRTAGEDRWVAADPVMVATALRTTLREADTACRLADGRFALVLEDTPEDGAVWAVERLRRTLLPGRPELVVWAGVACYPAHAFDAMDVLERAAEALVSAREWRRDRIEVAPSPD